MTDDRRKKFLARMNDDTEDEYLGFCEIITFQPSGYRFRELTAQKEEQNSDESSSSAQPPEDPQEDR